MHVCIIETELKVTLIFAMLVDHLDIVVWSWMMVLMAAKDGFLDGFRNFT